MSSAEFWDKSKDSGEFIQQLKTLKSSVDPWQAVFKKLEDLKGLAELAKEEDRDLLADLDRNAQALEQELAGLE